MPISEFAAAYHEKMFPGYQSDFLRTDPEFIERFDNFTFDEVINQEGQQLDDKTTMLSFSTTEENAKELMQRMPEEHFAINEGLSKLSLVGAGMATHSGVAAKALATLFENSIQHYQITASEISISITVDKENLQRACDVLTAAFDLCEE